MDGDGLPNTICSKCLAKLNIAWQFKMQCESSDAKLRQFYFNNSQQLQIAQNFDGFDYGIKQEQELCLLKKDVTATTFNNVVTELVNYNNVCIFC